MIIKICSLALLCAYSSAKGLRGINLDTTGGTHNPQHSSDHEKVFATVIMAFNDLTKLPTLVDLFGEERDGATYPASSNSSSVEYCDPYPHCLTTRSSIKAHLQKIGSTLADVHLTPLPQSDEFQTKLWNEKSGGFWVLSLAYSLPSTPNATVGQRGGLAQLTDAFLSWELSERSTPEKPIITSLRLNYDEETLKTRLSRCQPDVSDLMLYDPIPATEVPLLTDKIRAMMHTVSTVSPHFDCPAGTLRGDDGLLQCDWVHAWTDIFDHTTNATLCEPAVPTADHCRYGRKAIGEMLPSEDLYATTFLPMSPIMVAGNVATILTVWSSEAVDPAGCIESHTQVVQFELTHSQAKEDWGLLSKMRLFYGQNLEGGLSIKKRACSRKQS